MEVNRRNWIIFYEKHFLHVQKSVIAQINSQLILRLIEYWYSWCIANRITAKQFYSELVETTSTDLTVDFKPGNQEFITKIRRESWVPCAPVPVV